MTFKEAVHAIVRSIPVGQVLTYKEVAERAGNYKAARAVGRILFANDRSFITVQDYSTAIPCHRVVASNYALGGFNGGLDVKMRLLKREGWKIVDGKLERKKHAK